MPSFLHVRLAHLRNRFRKKEWTWARATSHLDFSPAFFVIQADHSHKMKFIVRPETPKDIQVIRQVTDAAFAGKSFSSGTEGLIVDALRKQGALYLSLVATIGPEEQTDEQVIGHVAFSPVTIRGMHTRERVDVSWFGLGPVSVRPDLQGRSIGGALILEGLNRLKAAGAQGCVVLGAPGYYRRFGFAVDETLKYNDAPTEHFMKLSFDESIVQGTVTFHKAFLS